MKFLIYLIFLIFFISNSNASIKEKIINSFKEINNFSFDFIQTIDGKDERGSCIIKFPKKINCIYKQKKSKLLVSNGKTLVIKNISSKQYYLYPLHTTPLNIILNKNLIINNIKKSEVKEIGEKFYNFEINDKKNIINIFFDKENYNLTGWQTEDIYQNLTITYIYNLKINEKLKEKIFKLPKNF
tara:strand:+ start:4103 stop:4657 length:555 start_codon:yes stop_codon:yes gene_type:complete